MSIPRWKPCWIFQFNSISTELELINTVWRLTRSDRGLWYLGEPRWRLLSGPLSSSPPCAAPSLYISLFMPKSSSPFFFYQNLLVPVRLFFFFPSSQILPVKNTGEKMRGKKWRGAKSLSRRGPIKRAPFFSKECAQRWREMKEARKKKEKEKAALYSF